MRRKKLIFSVLLLLILTIISLIVVLLNQPRSVQISSVDKKAFDELVEKITTTTTFEQDTPYLSITSSSNQIDGGNFLNRIYLTQPRMAMYKLRAAVIEHGVVNPQNEAYRQSFGIIGGKTFQMIPGQVDLEYGFVDQIELELITVSPVTTIDLYLYFENELGDLKVEQFIQHSLAPATPDQ